MSSSLEPSRSEGLAAPSRPKITTRQPAERALYCVSPKGIENLDQDLDDEDAAKPCTAAPTDIDEECHEAVAVPRAPCLREPIPALRL